MKRKIKSPGVSSDYSSFNPVILEKKGRLKMARQIYSVINVYLKGKKLKELKVLDVGCANGIISNFLSTQFGKVYAIDNDKSSIDYAKKTFRVKNLIFKEGDALKTGFKDESFDVVVANQIYYCFKRPEKFFAELNRIVKKGGIVFLGARNKYTLWDAQYHLPLLAVMPKVLASFFVKVSGRSRSFDAEYRNFWQLMALCKNFKVTRCTPLILSDPDKFGYRGIQKYEYITKHLPIFLWRFIEPVLPNFIWILKKR